MSGGRRRVPQCALGVATAVALLAACGGADQSNVTLEGPPASELSAQTSRSAATVEQGADPSADYSLNRDLTVGGRTATLADDPSNELMGRFSPRLIASGDGRTLVYTAWREIVNEDPAKSWADQGIEPGDPLGVPELHLVDLVGGTDEVLESGAYSAAVRADGAIAFARGAADAYKAGSPYPADLVVRSGQSTEVWSDNSAGWVAGAWARDTLLAYRLDAAEDSEGWTLVALPGPGRVVDLGINLAVGAISPDGGQVLLVDQTVFAPTEQDDDRVAASVINLADARRIASLSVGEMKKAGVDSFLPGGDWLGSQIVVPGQPGVTLLSFEANRLVIESASGLGPGLAFGAYDATFSEDGAGLSLWAAGPTSSSESGPGTVREVQARALSCDARATSCVASESMDPLQASSVRNPSRPSEGPR